MFSNISSLSSENEKTNWADFVTGSIYNDIMETNSLYTNCLLCPRRCGVDRLSGCRGGCGESAELRIAFAGLHRGEEPPLSGQGGSGVVFVSGCNLGCVFCQNHQISRRGAGEGLGRTVSTEEFAAICLALQRQGAENINIVTGSHAAAAIIQGLAAAHSKGLTIPVLWNSSGYESLATLELLRDHIAMYLPDLKTLDSDLALQFFNAPNYPQAAAAAILKMIAYRPRNVIIRHLILPGLLDSTRAVLQWFAENANGQAQLSLMTQYTPIKPGGGENSAAPNRCLNIREYETVLGWLDEFGIDEGFCQELATGNDWLPDFNRTNPFSSELSKPLWHFADNG